MTEPADPFEAGLLLADAFDAEGVSYALGGALALGLWGIPRVKKWDEIATAHAGG